MLPAGDYTFTLDHATLNGHILIRQQNQGIAIVMAQGIGAADSSGASSMLIVGNRVRFLHLARAGVTYNYQIHPERREILARSSGVPGVNVSIATK